MIYKIIGNFTDENFDKIIEKVASRFKFMYCNDTLYISMKSIDSIGEDREFLYKIFDFYLLKLSHERLKLH